jgi:DMSO/TMAO reductase YedYZ molybdopterin-dependent catalytic subunit
MMKRFSHLDRRFVLKGLAGAATLPLAACDRIDASRSGQTLLDAANDASYRVQRMLLGADRPAPEFAETDISKVFRANGSIDPKDKVYRRMTQTKFATWALEVDGLVEAPRKYTLAQLRALPARTQITRHDCVEGWSCIGKWRGPRLETLLDEVRPKPEARYVIFHCADVLDTDQSEGDSDDADADDDEDEGGARSGGGLQAQPDKFYGSIDLDDARHPQTILAYEMNGLPLPVAHGAPLRLRVERQLGYKMSKYIMRIELVANFTALGRGKGGYWEDNGYDWYAGI